MTQAIAAELRLNKAVQARPPLWNKGDEKYLDQGLKPRLWSKVALEAEFPRATAIDKDAAKTRWTSLRDRFLKLRKAARDKKITGSGADEDPVDVKWPYYNAMMFLEDAAKPRQSHRSSLEDVVLMQKVSPPEEPDENEKDLFEGTPRTIDDDDDMSVKTAASGTPKKR